MKTMETTFNRDKFAFKQVYRKGMWCIYRKTKPGTQIESYELVRLKTRPAMTFQGKAYEERESYPGSEEWGTYGWTCPTKTAAFKRLAKETLSEP